jgi:hypothetical protein
MAGGSCKIAVLGALLGTILSIITGARYSYAEVTSKPNLPPLSISHTPPKPKELPIPGAPMELIVSLKNTRDSERTLRAFMVVDGQMMDISVPSAKFNAQDEPSYTISLNAPVGEILYQFILYNPDGTYSISDRYFVRRSCIPDISPAPDTLPDASRGDKRLLDLVVQSKALERDIENYQRIISLLNDIKKLTGE